MIHTDIWAEASGDKIFVRIWNAAPDYKTNPPIIMLHDSLGCVELWRDFPAKIAALTNRPVIAYDRLGFGKSDSRHDQIKPDFIAQEIHTFEALLTRLSINTFYLLGHSVGGPIGITLAAHYWENTVGLIAISPTPIFIEDRTLNGITEAEIFFSNPEKLQKLAQYHGDKTEWVFRAWVDTWKSDAFANWTMDEYIRNIQCPALIIHGDNDEFASLEHPVRIQSLSPSFTDVIVLKKCAHYPHRENPDIVLGHIQKFLYKK